MDAATITAITNAVNYDIIITGISTIGSSVAVLYVAYRGIRMILSAIRSA